MAGIAKITLVGNLGRDPETRYTPNGKMNVTFTMAVSRRFNDQSGQQQERTNWYRVTAWGGLAESLDRLAQSGYLAKGKQVYVDSEGGFGGGSLGAAAGAGAAAGRSPGGADQEEQPGSIEEVPWDDGEPPF